MTAIRKAAVAGMFYPDAPDVLKRDVQGYLDAPAATSSATPKAIIAPHAGYRYSGATAGKIYARLKPARDIITRVILMGPCHRVAVRGLALSGADAFETPLGRVPVDKNAEARIGDLPGITTFPPTHAQEHALEVHLPFLQEVLTDFKVVPIVVGEAAPEEVAAVLQKLWGGPETLIVISSDLSHFLDYDGARAIDARTAAAITSFEPGKIERNGACGRFPVGGLLHLAKQRGMRVETVDMCNSGDTAGSKDKVVGYGAWAFYESDDTPENIAVPAEDFEAATKQLLKTHGDTLLQIADASIRTGLKTGAMLKQIKGVPNTLTANGATFVTLKTAKGQLRGCIGSAQAHRALAWDVAENAYKAAFKDPRFPPISADEYETLRLSISVLSPQAQMRFTDEADLLSQLRPGVDGLVISDGTLRALFLPSVWSQLPTPDAFLGQLKRKAGMAADHWSETFRASRFIAEEIHHT